MGLLQRNPRARFGAEEVFAALGGAPPLAIVEEQPGLALIGRDSYFQQVRQDFQRVIPGERQTGGVGVVWMAGAPGIGRSAFLQSFADSCEMDALVLQGRCQASDGVPFQVLDPWMDQLCLWLLSFPPARRSELLHGLDDIARLFPIFNRLGITAPASSDDPRAAAFTAVRTLFRRVSLHTPLVLIADDVQ